MRLVRCGCVAVYPSNPQAACTDCGGRGHYWVDAAGQRVAHTNAPRWAVPARLHQLANRISALGCPDCASDVLCNDCVDMRDALSALGTWFEVGQTKGGVL